MKNRTWLLAFVFLFLNSGCQAMVRDWQRDRLITHLSRLKSYHGILREKGVTQSKDDLVSEIWFAQPMKYFIKILSPEKYAGSTLIYNGSDLYLFFPKTKYGILYRNLQHPNGEDFTKLIDEGFNYNMDHFQYELGSKHKILNFEVVDLLFKAKAESLLTRSGISQIYDELSFPIAGELLFNDGQKYQYEFDSLEFNSAIAADRFLIPKGQAEILSEWDAGDKGISEAEAKKAANFSFRLPAVVPSGFHLTKIIKQKGPVPAFTAIYEKRPFFISIASFKDYGISLIPIGRGLHLKGKTPGELLPNPHLSSYSFMKSGVQYNITGNVPVDEIVQTAESF